MKSGGFLQTLSRFQIIFSFAMIRLDFPIVKLRYCEKATQFEKWEILYNSRLLRSHLVLPLLALI